MKKYEFTEETKKIAGHTLHRIRAVRDFGDVKTGDFGRWIEKEENLSHNDNAWVFGDARVSGCAKIQHTGDYIVLQGFGSANRITTFFKTADGTIGVKCGCFYGTLDEFEEKVKETHGDERFAKEYLAAAAAMRVHFEVDVNDDKKVEKFEYPERKNSN